MTSIRKLKNILLTQQIANEEQRFQNLKETAKIKQQAFLFYQAMIEEMGDKE